MIMEHTRVLWQILLEVIPQLSLLMLSEQVKKINVLHLLALLGISILQILKSYALCYYFTILTNL